MADSQGGARQTSPSTLDAARRAADDPGATSTSCTQVFTNLLTNALRGPERRRHGWRCHARVTRRAKTVGRGRHATGRCRGRGRRRWPGHAAGCAPTRSSARSSPPSRTARAWAWPSCRKIVDAHDGAHRPAARRAAAHGDDAVRVTLPVERPDDDAVKLQSGRRHDTWDGFSSPTTTIRCAAASRSALAEAGHDVEEAPNGNAAIERLHEGVFDVVVSDLRMGGSGRASTC